MTCTPAPTITEWTDGAAAALAAHLVAAHSVTSGLQTWCEAHGIGEGPVRILSRAGGAPPVRLVAVLDAPESEFLSYRRVVLGRGRIALVEAELLYRNAALTEEMHAALNDGLEPFGAVVAPLAPRRETVSQEIGTTRCGLPLRFTARIVLATGEGLAAVDERFLPTLLAPRGSLARA